MGRGVCLMLMLCAQVARAKPRPEVQRAIDFFDKADDERAAALLHRTLKQGLPLSDAALCHIYLGLIELNALATSRAKDEFKEALSIDATIELPRTVTPKAKDLFVDALRELRLPNRPDPQAQIEAPPPLPQQLQVVVQPVTPAPPVATAPAGPETIDGLRVASYSVGGIGLGAMLTGGILFIAAAGTLSGMNGAPDLATAVQLSNRYPKQEYAAEWFMTCGAIGVGLGVVGWLVDHSLAQVAPTPLATGARSSLQLLSDGVHF